MPISRGGLIVLVLTSIAGGTLKAQAWPDPADPLAMSSGRPPVQPDSRAASAPGLPKRDAAGYWHIDFGVLASFPYGHPRASPDGGLKRSFSGHLALLRPDESNIIDPPTEPGTGGIIPDAIVALNGQRVRLGGYMLPVRMVDGLATQFLILRNQSMCCFGLPPAPNEWVVVRMKGKGLPSRMDTPLYFYGTLRVGDIFTNKVFEGLYELEVEKASDS